MSSSGTERRFNPLTKDWVLVSKGRNDRPWTGQVENSQALEKGTSYDATCALCPGNSRATGAENPQYEGVYVFDNDFPAIAASADAGNAEGESDDESPLFVSQTESGICRVICFDADHNITLARMSTAEIVPVIEGFVDQTAELFGKQNINHVQIFENRGETMGCSNPHPHGQIWAQASTPSIPARELDSMTEYFCSRQSTLLSDYVNEELTRGERIVFENREMVVLVPYWAAWPFETMVIPKRPIGTLVEFTPIEIEAFAEAIHQVTVRYDNLFRTSFPYSSGIHQRPLDADEPAAFHLHMHFYPPLLRSATVRKFMVGYEMLGEPQRDLSPEEAAALLRNQAETHYLDLSAA